MEKFDEIHKFFSKFPAFSLKTMRFFTKTYSLNLDFAVFSQHLLLLNLTYITNLFEGCSSHHAVYGIEQCFFRPWVKLLLLNKSAIFLAKL